MRSNLIPLIHSPLDAMDCVSQMPVILLPLHFDRDPNLRPPIPSCQRSVAIRTFITTDFMTGVPAIPGIDLPLEVSYSWSELCTETCITDSIFP